MDTYGDMVTLLLCFFVLLYSMSTVSQEKWKMIVQSFNPSAVESSELSQIVTITEPNDSQNEPVKGSHDPAEEQDSFDELYRMMKQFVQQNGYAQDIEISKGDGFTFITFRDNVFFDGDSYYLKEEGKIVLDQVSEALASAGSSIQEVRILGHTSQALPTQPNEPISDRFLASNRATQVLLHIQLKNILSPEKLVACSYGQFRPISPFDTRESRAKNRRVEILVTKNNSEMRTLEEYYREINLE